MFARFDFCCMRHLPRETLLLETYDVEGESSRVCKLSCGSQESGEGLADVRVVSAS
jgi:hypothetical protein